MGSVYCAGVPEERLSAELFGQPTASGERNIPPRPGKMEMANHGTLYLSDLVEAGPRVLERLERFLAPKAGAPGGGRENPADVRFVASTVVPPEELARNGKFPQGLLRALEQGTVRIPPLRERNEDVPMLLHHFLQEANRDRKKPLRGFTPAALSILEPGSYLGEMAMVDDAPRSADARAHAPCALAVLKREDLDHLMFIDKDLAYDVLWTFVRTLTARLRETNDDS